MKILFVGDIYGRPGKKVASKFIPKYIEEEGVDFCIANGVLQDTIGFHILSK